MSINWSKIKEVYESRDISISQIAKIYNISPSSISKRAKKEEWERYVKTNDTIFIDKQAQKQFKKIKEKLSDSLMVVDEPLLVALCNQISRYQILEKKVQLEGEVILSTKGVPYLNPTFTALQSILKTLSSLSKEFGLTIASRKRSGVNVDDSKNEKTLFDLAEEIKNLEVDV